MSLKPTNINEHEGKKYLRRVFAADGSGQSVLVDVYAVLMAFDVTCPARAHAIKKLLAAGTRGKGGTIEDLIGVHAALSRAIDLQRQRENLDAAASEVAYGVNDDSSRVEVHQPRTRATDDGPYVVYRSYKGTKKTRYPNLFWAGKNGWSHRRDDALELSTATEAIMTVTRLRASKPTRNNAQLNDIALGRWYEKPTYTALPLFLPGE